VPCWDKECETLYSSFIRAPAGTDSDRAASCLLFRLEQKEQEQWEETVNFIEFLHSSCKALSTINKLTGRSVPSSHLYSLSANSIVSQPVKNGEHRSRGSESTRLINKELSNLWMVPTPVGHSICDPFRLEELAAALRRLRPGTSPVCIPSSRNLYSTPDRLSNLGFATSCMRQLKIPRISRRALIVAIPKPEKPMGGPMSYRPISLLCVPFKILERLIYACVEAIIDPLLPQEQAGFQHGRSTINQLTMLTQDTEDSISAKKKAGAVFVDLTAAYDTVWHRGLTCKLLQLLPDRHMFRTIMEMVRNCSFTINTGNDKRRRLPRLRTASNRNLSWRPFSSTSTFLTCRPSFPE